MNTIRILVVDDHAIARLGLLSLLETEEGLAVVGQAEDGESAIVQAEELKPDVVIMDLVMPGMDGVSATRAISARLPQTKILVLTTFGGSDDIAHALEAGATGALMKNTEINELIDAIRSVAAGRQVLAPEIRKMLAENPPVPELTPRQMEILHSVTRGLTNRDIANQLGITIDGVKDHINAILAKIGAANRSEAVAIAFRKHLLKI
ncbi:MAG: response regulator transcription factor [Kiritimatiellae bacterium]|nr:response regulator transcription factor [Kiritimatiellia bacterium]